MRILHVIDHLGPGGAQTVLLDLLACWPEPADQIQVVALGSGDALRDRLEQIPNVRVAILARRRWDFSGLRDWDAPRSGPSWDVLHAHLNKSILTSLATPRRIARRRIIHLHGDPARERLLAGLLRSLGRRADAVLGVSERTSAGARRAAPKLDGRLRTVRNGIDPRRLEDRTGLQAIRERVRGPVGDAFVLAFVGRLDRAKGLHYLLPALARTPSNVALVVVGDGDQRAALQRETARLNLAERVRFVGFQHQVAPWIAAADCLVLPSLTEGLPMTILEAFAVGTPVVASRVGGVEEIVRDGESGLCVAPRDVTGLQAAIERLRQSASLRDRLIRGGRQQLEAFHTAERMAALVREAYLDAGICRRA